MPALPDIRLTVLEERAEGEPGFLCVVRRKLRAEYPDGTRSAEFVYDEVRRRAQDAVVLVVHFQRDGERLVYLRSAVRPPLQFRRNFLPSPTGAGLWELPAGLIEADEESEAGLLRCAQRELREELGFAVEAHQLHPLGPSTFPCPGVLGERHFFFEVEVVASARSEPTLDGSALEHGGVVLAVRLQEALAWCRQGTIEDAKTELGLRRLLELAPSAVKELAPSAVEELVR
jgi:ADP-ribose pyrophosphatase